MLVSDSVQSFVHPLHRSLTGHHLPAQVGV